MVWWACLGLLWDTQKEGVVKASTSRECARASLIIEARILLADIRQSITKSQLTSRNINGPRHHASWPDLLYNSKDKRRNNVYLVREAQGRRLLTKQINTKCPTNSITPQPWTGLISKHPQTGRSDWLYCIKKLLSLYVSVVLLECVGELDLTYLFY